MKLPLSRLLLVLLWVCSSQGASSDTFVVSQSPDVTVTEGQTATIDCCWTKEFIRVKVKWMKNQIEIKETTFRNNSQESQNSCSTLTLPNIKLEASGRYICSVTVDIPRLTTVEGSGTVITVTARENTDVNTDHHVADDASNEEVLIYVLRCLPILALVLAFLWLYYSGTKAQQNAQAASRNKPTAPQSREEDQEEDQVEEEEDERVTEAARE
ncbi:uncharacterized protein PAE49_021605 isoform 1-T1 [Odontesthes bonariensis]|uniref:uncharacterized protein LOC142368934 n=1 Tax=Odontesthes bonariensis TaxID=219752 RepID=UPI003F580FDB